MKKHKLCIRRLRDSILIHEKKTCANYARIFSVGGRYISDPVEFAKALLG